MAKYYEDTVKLVERIPDEKTLQWLFRSLLGHVHPDDQVGVVVNLLNYVQHRAPDEEQEAVK